MSNNKNAKVNLGEYTTEDDILDAIEGSTKITRLIISAVQKGSKFEVSQVLEHYGLSMSSRLHFKVANTLMNKWFTLTGINDEEKIWDLLKANSSAMNKLKQNVKNGTMALSDILTEWELPIGQLQSKIIRRIISHFKDNKNNNNRNKLSKPNITTEWKHKHINEWTCNDLQSWIISLSLSNRNKEKLTVTISEQEISGADFNSMEEISDVMDSFEIERNIANQIYASLLKIRTLKVDNINLQQKQMNDNKNSGNISKDEVKKQDTDNKVSVVTSWSNNDLLNWIKTIGLETQWQEIMIGIIESNGCTGNDWFMVKNFKEFAKKFNITQTMLANRVFREFRKVKRKRIDDNVGNNDIEQNMDKTVKKSIAPPKPVVVNIWDRKHINEWTCDVLKQWIKSLHLNKNNEKKVIESITEQEVSGADFNSIEEAVDLIDSLEINNDCAMKIFTALEKVRKK
eukprot:467706_1